MTRGEEKTKRKGPRFSLRTLLVAMAFLGIILAWMVDHWRLSKQLDAQQNESKSVHQRLDSFVDWFAAHYWDDNLPSSVKELVREATGHPKQ